MSTNRWFDVDKDGLAKILDRRGGKAFILYELLQNAWDEECTEVHLKLSPIENKPACMLSITDDSPDGFADLRDAFTLFAESKKKNNPESRGRFNLGEKLVLACCRRASVISTKGGVEFKEDGTRVSRRGVRKSGTLFEAEVSMTREEYKDCCEAIDKLLPPDNQCVTYFNDRRIQHRKMVAKFEATLPTEVSGADGSLRRTSRKTTVEIYPVKDGEVASIYEMGIPVVETGDKYHVNVLQTVPTNLDRDNVTPSYLRKIRTLTLNAIHTFLTDAQEVNAGWVRDALEDKDCSNAAAITVVTKRYGDKVVSFDPSDPEANNIAVSQGYTVVPGGAYSRATWEKIRESEQIKPAGKVTPSPKPYTPGGRALKTIPRDDWTKEMQRFADYATMVGKILTQRWNLLIVFADEPSWGFMGTYGPKAPLVVNVGGRYKSFVQNFPDNIVEVDDFLIHEFSHHFESNHLSSSYHEACTRLGAELKAAVLKDTSAFKKYLNLPQKA